jgi:hypothetical protein
MRSRVPNRYFLIPVLYVLIVLFFVQLHVTGGGRISTEKVGPVELWMKESGGMNKGIESARLSLYGFNIELSGGVEFRSADGATRRVGIDDIRISEGTVEMSLANGGMLKIANGYPAGAGMFRFPELFGPSSDYRGVAFFYEAPQGDGKDLPVLPFVLQRQGEIELPRETLPIAVTRSDDEAFLCAGERAPMLEGSTAWYSLPGGGQTPDVVVSPWDGESITDFWIFGELRKQDGSAYAKARAAYLDAAYAGWKERYSSDEGAWERTQPVRAAQEKIIAGLAAESLRRNGTVGLDRFAAAIEEGTQTRSLLSAPFLGSLVQLDEQMRQEEQQRASELASLAEQENPELFAGVHDLAPFLVLHGDQNLIRSIDGYAATLARSRGLTAAQAAGLFLFYSAAAEKYAALFPETAELGAEFFSRLLPHFARQGEHLLYTGDERVDIGSGLHLGRALTEYGERSGNSLASALGNTLSVGYLERADEQGFLPRSLTVSVDGISGSGEQLAPETAYPWVSDNPFYPRVVSLAEEIDPQVRLYTVAQGVGAVRNGNTVTITLDYEVGETEHAIVRGLGDFSNFFFYGLRWSSDRRFQDYAVGGWYYNSERDTLYMKIRHQQKVERIMFDQ